jgi:hypothetical protein
LASLTFVNHIGAEDTEIAQRRSSIRTFRAKPLELRTSVLETDGLPVSLDPC